ncbi:MAG: hypothetical protein K8R31_12960 [Bacteroidales bacterium]|nr:hypothetical protein [Bacteroidales bacterium]
MKAEANSAQVDGSSAKVDKSSVQAELNSAKVADNSAQAEANSALVDRRTKPFTNRYYKHFVNPTQSKRKTKGFTISL